MNTPDTEYRKCNAIINGDTLVLILDKFWGWL